MTFILKAALHPLSTPLPWARFAAQTKRSPRQILSGLSASEQLNWNISYRCFNLCHWQSDRGWMICERNFPETKYPLDISAFSNVCAGNIISKKLFCKPCLLLRVFDGFQKHNFFKNKHSSLTSLELKGSQLADRNINNKMLSPHVALASFIFTWYFRGGFLQDSIVFLHLFP